MIMMTDWIDKVNSVLMAYYPGMEGGNALAEILFGDVNPSGKLPFVVPVKEEDLPKVDWEATDQYYEYYHGYTRLDKNGVKPLVPYGFGLSYTTFSIETPSASVEGDELVTKVKVTNTGDRDGAEVVQLYVGFENSAVDRPVRQLRGFEKVFLKAGESKEVTVKTPLEKLKYYNPVEREWVLEKMKYQIYLGSSEALEDLVQTEITL
jgi:beta-glucosidase